MPYVQRSVITLRQKGAEFAITYVDLQDPPAWFEKISPLGQVPVLRVRRPGQEEAVLFESAVINEYLDETIGPPMHPADPLERAYDRAWIEVASGLLAELYGYMIATDAETERAAVEEIFETLGRVEERLGAGPYWRGRDLCLVDAAWAPLFVRFELLPVFWEHAFWKAHPKTRAWAQALLETPSVRGSVRGDFEKLFYETLKGRKSGAPARRAT